MTQVLEVKSSARLTGCLPRMCKLEGVSDGAVLKLSSATHTFYLVYTPTVSQQHKLVELSKEFLQCNNIPEGFYKAQEIVAKDIKELKVMVSKRDWEVINATASVLEQQFLGQAKVVWEGLVIPLHYAQASYVKINCICEKGVWRLRENSKINVDFQEQKQNSEAKPFQKLCFTMKQSPNDLQQGYNDTLLVDQRHFENCLKQNTYYVAQSNELIPQQNIANFQEYIKYVSKSTEEKQKSSNRPTKWLIRCSKRKIEDRTTAVCNKVFSSLYQLPRKIILLKQLQPKDKDVCLTNQLFISPSNKIQIFFLPVRPSFQHSSHHLQKLIDMLLVSNTLFVHGRLFYLQGEFFLTRIEKFQKGVTQVIDSLMVKKVREYGVNQALRKKFVEECRKRVFVCEHHLYEVAVAEAERGYLNKIINGYRHREGTLARMKEVSRLFETFYQEQVKKLFDCISKKQHVMLYSPNKNGKTFTYHYLLSRDYPVFYVDFEEISSDTTHRIKDVLEYIELVFSTQASSSILFLDNLASLCKVVTKDLNRQHEFIASRVLSRQLVKFIDLYCQQTCILVVQNPENVDQELKNIELTQIMLKNPQTEERRKYFERIATGEEAHEMIRNTESMSFGQVLGVLADRERLMGLAKKKEVKEVLHDFTRIAGLNKAKSTIIQTMEAPFKYSYLYKDLPIKMPKGVLLYGPSGVGKTYLATAVKQQVKMKFFEFKGSDILNMYIGASEQAVRDIFEKAMSVSPSIVFFDEFESIVPKRTANNTGVTDRIVNQFLCYLDGVSSLQGVFILAASSRPDMIDPALLRPGRIDKHIYLEYPDQSQRLELLKIYKDAINFQQGDNQIVKKTQNFSYSDLVGLMKELRIKKANRLLKQTPVNTEEFKTISVEFFDQILKSYRISTSVEQQKLQRKRYELFSRGEADSIQNQRIAFK